MFRFQVIMTANVAALAYVVGGAAVAQNTTFVAPPGQIIALQSNIAACPDGGQIVPFAADAFQMDGATFAFDPNPPAVFPNGAAVAALYSVGADASGQPTGQFCVDGACLANGNRCSAIAFIQPNGVRVYSRK